MTATFKCRQCQSEVTLLKGRVAYCPSCGSRRGLKTPPRAGERPLVTPQRKSLTDELMTCPTCRSKARLERSYCARCGAHFLEPRVQMTLLGTARYVGGGDIVIASPTSELAVSPERVLFGGRRVAAMSDVASVEVTVNGHCEIGIRLASGAAVYFALPRQIDALLVARLQPILQQAGVPLIPPGAETITYEAATLMLGCAAPFFGPDTGSLATR